MTDRALQLHCARVYLAQARVWRLRAATLPWYWHSFWQYLDSAMCAGARQRTALRARELAGTSRASFWGITHVSGQARRRR